MPLSDELRPESGVRSWTARMREHLGSGLLRNSGWMLCAQSLQLAGRVGYFFIAAHILGPTGFGTFVACTALMQAIAPFAGFGSEHVTLKYVARDATVVNTYFGNALLVTVMCAGALAGLVLLLRQVLLPTGVSTTMVLAVACADLLAMQVVAICQNTFNALQQFRSFTLYSSLAPGARLAAAGALFIGPATPLHWSFLYAGATLAAALIGIAAVVHASGRPRLQPQLMLAMMREGFHFSTATASQSVYNDIDKTMLARLSSVEAAAIYALAYRFVDAAMMPIRAVATAAYPEFFRRGARGLDHSYRYARSILPQASGYGIAVSVLLFLLAPVVPYLAGSGYAEAAWALRWLCLLAAIKSVHAFLTDALTGAGLQWQRSLIQIAVAVVNVALNLWLIRAYAWRGAAWSSLLTDGLLASALFAAIRWNLRRQSGAAYARVPEPTSSAV